MENMNLIGNINVVFEKLFGSIEKDIFKTLDDILIISEDIVKKEPLSNLISINGINYITVIANSLILFFAIYYTITNFICMYNGNKQQHVFKFILKLIIVGILANFAVYICTSIIEINNILTTTIDEIAGKVSKDRLSFECLKDRILDVNEYMKDSDALSLNGIIKGMLSFGSVSVLLTFAVRYVTVLFLILISPIAFICLSSKLTSGIFYSYIKIFIINLMMQNVIKLILLIPIACKNTTNLMYKIIMVGSIYTIYKANTFTKEIFNKITSDKFGREHDL